MAFEFIAPIASHDPPFIVLADRLQSEGICVTDSVTSTEARFRWPGSKDREGWSSDAELSMTEKGVLLTIHSGNKQQRSQLVKSVALMMAQLLGEPIDFEEA